MINWVKTRTNGDNHLRVAYRGPLAGPDLRLHYGFDGWQEPTQESRLEEIEPGLAITEPMELAHHIALDCVVTDGTHWDNNHEADYRLWIGFDPLDAHGPPPQVVILSLQ